MYEVSSPALNEYITYQRKGKCMQFMYFMFLPLYFIECFSCSSAPESVELLSELNDAVAELESRISPLLSRVSRLKRGQVQ